MDAVRSLAESRAIETQRLRGVGSGVSWWSHYFGGPLWLRAIKASAYFYGFYREMLRLIS